MWEYNYSTELYHFGIKGMRWGVRRYQNKDGSLTKAGEKRYSDKSPYEVRTVDGDVFRVSRGSNRNYNSKKSKVVKTWGEHLREVDNEKLSKQSSQSMKKSKHRLNLEEKYRKGGLSKEDAEIAADKRIKKERIIAAAAGLTIAAATAYVVNKNLKEKCDGIIKSGKTLQRIEMQDTGGKLYDQFYAAKDRADKSKYAGLLGKTRLQQTGHAYMMNIGVDKDIKVAGRDKAVKTFEKLYKSDSGFKNAVESMSKKNIQGGNSANGNIKKMYDNFNSRLVNNRDSDAVKKFYGALKSEGYGAIKDMNDSKFSGYKAKNPLIIFDHAGKVSVNSFREMDVKEVNKKYGKYRRGEIAKEIGKLAALPVSAIIIQDNTIENYENKKRR